MESPLSLITLNILNLTIFPWNIHRWKLLRKNKAINLPSKAQWGNSCLLSTPTTAKLYFYFLTLCCFAKNSHLLLHASLPDNPAMPRTQTAPTAPQFPVLSSKHPHSPGTHSMMSHKGHTQVQFLAQSEMENLLELHHAGVGFHIHWCRFGIWAHLSCKMHHHSKVNK